MTLAFLLLSKDFQSMLMPASDVLSPKRRGAALRWCILVTATLPFSAPARADRIENGTAVFSALDKVTATTQPLDVPLGETKQFGALKVTPRACYSRPSTEQPKTTAFVEVDEIQLDGKEKRIFTGWMFAESPGLNAVEHPVFDVWLRGCANPKRSVATGQPAPQPGAEPGSEPAVSPEEEPEQRRRVRR